MIDASRIAEAVREAIPRAATRLRPDVLAALKDAAERERSSRGRAVLEQLLENNAIAERDAVPLCQDTGTVWVRIELGRGECLVGDIEAEVNAAVADAYRSGALRMSVARDALLDRSNTGDNTPAFIEVGWRHGDGATVHVMLKGAGSDNASRVAMLTPDGGLDAVAAFVAETVVANAANACPPLVVGVGVGSTFDKVGSLAKRALLRSVGSDNEVASLQAFEQRLLQRVNESGIGPGGLGGNTTALAVHVLTAPCHIAALPVAVNIGCSAVRSETIEVMP